MTVTPSFYFNKKLTVKPRATGVGGKLRSEKELFKSKSHFFALLQLELNQTYCNLLITFLILQLKSQYVYRKLI